MATATEILQQVAKNLADLTTAFNNQSATANERLTKLETAPVAPAEAKAKAGKVTPTAVLVGAPQERASVALAPHRRLHLTNQAGDPCTPFYGGLAHDITVVVTPTNGKPTSTTFKGKMGQIGVAKQHVQAAYTAGHKVEIRT